VVVTPPGAQPSVKKTIALDAGYPRCSHAVACDTWRGKESVNCSPKYSSGLGCDSFAENQNLNVAEPSLANGFGCGGDFFIDALTLHENHLPARHNEGSGEGNERGL
jgi:hypothetical protein